MPCFSAVREDNMQENALRQERKYCARLGWAFVLTMVCAFVWQFALLLLAYSGRLLADPTTYGLLALVAGVMLQVSFAQLLAGGFSYGKNGSCAVGLAVGTLCMGVGLYLV